MKLRIDLRDVPPAKLDGIVARFPEESGFLLTSWQWNTWRRHGANVPYSSRVILMVPDFLHYARLASTGQMSTIIDLPKSTLQVVQSAIKCVPTGMRNLGGIAKGNFWAGAAALMAYDVGLIENDFAGKTLLHYNLSDFTWLFERKGFLEEYSRLRPGGGVATLMVPKALSACSRWSLVPDTLLFPVGYNRSEQSVLELAINRDFAETSMIIDFTQWAPEMVQSGVDADFYRDTDAEWLVTPEAGIHMTSYKS